MCSYLDLPTFLWVRLFFYDTEIHLVREADIINYRKIM